jgi:hypothetical protein
MIVVGTAKDVMAMPMDAKEEMEMGIRSRKRREVGGRCKLMSSATRNRQELLVKHGVSETWSH